MSVFSGGACNADKIRLRMKFFSDISYAFALGAGGAMISALTVVAAASQQPPPDGHAIFLANSATCHGVDGPGMPTPADFGLDLAMPNFTDSSFAPREPATDRSASPHKAA